MNKEKLKKLTDDVKNKIKTYGPPALFGAAAVTAGALIYTQPWSRDFFMVDKGTLRRIGEGTTAAIFDTEKYGSLVLRDFPEPSSLNRLEQL